MKVLVVHNRYVSSNPSGENAVVDAEMRMLRDAGVDVVPYLRSSDEVIHISWPGKVGLAPKPLYATDAQQALRTLIAEHRPDVMHLHNPYPLISPSAVRTAHRSGVPVVQTVHNFRHVCMAGTLFRDGSPCRDCSGKRFGWPGLVHGCYRDSRAQSAVMASALLAHRATWRSVDRFVALTPLIADFLTEELGVDRNRILVKPNTVPDPGPPASAGRGFLFLGRLSTEKGLVLLRDAWRLLPEGTATLVIAGDGPQREIAQRLSGERRDVSYLGQVAPERASALLQEASALILPSVWAEVCPLAAIEALAHGRAVITTSMGGLPWVVADAGEVVEPSPEHLAAAIRAMAELGELPHYQRRARARYLSTFSSDVTLPVLLKAYEGLSHG